MKKKILPLFFVAIVWIGAGCTNEPVTEGLNFKKVYFFEVRSGDWTESLDNGKLNRFYHCSFKIKGIDNGVFDKGTVTAYIDKGNYQQPLPLIRHYENTNGEKWTRTIDYDYEVGKITFYVTNSDFVADPPKTMNFRVALMW